MTKLVDFAAVLGAVSLGIGLYLGWTIGKGALLTAQQYGFPIPEQFINAAPY